MMFSTAKRRSSGALLLAGALIVSLLAGCSDSPAPAATATVAVASTPTVVTPVVEATNTLEAGAVTPLPTAPADMPPTSTLQIDNYSFYQDGEYLTVFGEVSNPGATVLGRLEVSAEAKDASGATVGSGSAVYLTYVELWPGKLAPFRVDISGVSGEVASVEFSGEAENNAPDQDNALSNSMEVLNAELFAPPGEVPVLTGLVINTGTRPISDPDVSVAAYDTEGRIVGVGRESVLLSRLAPDSFAPFRVSLGREAEAVRFETLVTVSTGSDLPVTGLEVGPVSYYVDGSDLIAFGTVRNSGATTLERVTVAAYAESESGSITAAAVDSYLDATEINLPPGATAPFRAELEVDESRVAQVRVVADADLFSTEDFNFSVPAKLTVSNTSTAASAGVVSGDLKNDDTVAANYIVVLAIGYNAAGEPVNVGRVQLSGTVLEPGASTTFEVPFEQDDVAVTRVDVLATGLQQQ